MSIEAMIVSVEAVRVSIEALRLCGFKYIWRDISHGVHWYGYKNLVNTVLTVAVSDLHYSTLYLQRQCLI